MIIPVELDHSRPELRRPVVARGMDYAAGAVVAAHSHARAQLLSGSTGVVMVETPHGAWMMPPQRGLWIPAGVTHSVRMLGAVKMRSLYFAPRSVPQMPARCEVLAISPLMRNLLAEAVTLPPEYEVGGRDGMVMALIQCELPRLPVLPLSLPLPREPGLAARCRAFLAAPTPHDTIDDWARAARMSRRSFTRRFRARNRPQLCRLASASLRHGRPAPACGWRRGHDDRARPRLQQSGGLHRDVQAGPRRRPPRLSRGGRAIGHRRPAFHPPAC